MRGFLTKNCHISDLKITNCTQPGGKSRTRLWKTWWRMFNSTGGNRLSSRTFELSPPGFQHVEKIGLFYGMYSAFLWKTFCIGKTAVLPGAESTAAKNNSAKMGRSAYGCEKFSTKRQKSGNLLANPAGLCYTLSWIIIIKNHRVGCRCKLRGAPWGTCAASFR